MIYYNIYGKPIDLNTWSKLFHNYPYRKVYVDKLDECTISTVWLGLNHRFDDSLPPLIFETMIFGGDRDNEVKRYSTLEEAQEGHKKLVEELSLQK